jgi:hypothetical protein
MGINAISPFNKGDIVSIKAVSKNSFYLFKKYEGSSPLMIRPCSLKKFALVVEDCIEGGVTILRTKNGNYLTVMYSRDLELLQKDLL